MGTIKNFEELEIWKNSRELVIQIYSDFMESKDFVFVSSFLLWRRH